MSIREVYEEGRLISHKWSDRDDDGRELLCLLTAMAGDPKARPHTCSIGTCPRWLLYLLPQIDDFPSDSGVRGPIWRSFIERCIGLEDFWRTMTPAESRELELRCKRIALATQRTPQAITVLALLDEWIGAGSEAEGIDLLNEKSVMRTVSECDCRGNVDKLIDEILSAMEAAQKARNVRPT